MPFQLWPSDPLEFIEAAEEALHEPSSNALDQMLNFILDGGLSHCLFLLTPPSYHDPIIETDLVRILIAAVSECQESAAEEILSSQIFDCIDELKMCQPNNCSGLATVVFLIGVLVRTGVEYRDLVIGKTATKNVLIRTSHVMERPNIQLRDRIDTKLNMARTFSYIFENPMDWIKEHSYFWITSLQRLMHLNYTDAISNKDNEEAHVHIFQAISSVYKHHGIEILGLKVISARWVQMLESLPLSSRRWAATAVLSILKDESEIELRHLLHHNVFGALYKYYWVEFKAGDFALAKGTIDEITDLMMRYDEMTAAILSSYFADEIIISWMNTQDDNRNWKFSLALAKMLFMRFEEMRVMNFAALALALNHDPNALPRSPKWAWVHARRLQAKGNTFQKVL
ncbi:hypothetical protein K470DRAFT_260143 [Piedraia hortae CBS 480.64]|uniref:Uncharacterized protein n=1 Tax=Piedraia hortae CBS 480.64 TaxID=1314780 RepID=A0A6A7BSC7_9PEZI|nr:hypothetical protein K470DRAFT_260143 [Piedraia hortae CBS 480.64]